TYLDEAEWIADRIAEAWQATPERPPTAAVLIRRRDQIPPIEAALRARGLPVEVVGLGGLLDTPEVRDVDRPLRVLADPAGGAARGLKVAGRRLPAGRGFAGPPAQRRPLADGSPGPGGPVRRGPAARGRAPRRHRRARPAAGGGARPRGGGGDPDRRLGGPGR